MPLGSGGGLLEDLGFWPKYSQIEIPKAHSHMHDGMGKTAAAQDDGTGRE